VEIAMDCNLKAPDVVPVLLGFNYEAHNAPGYITFNTIGKYAQITYWCCSRLSPKRILQQPVGLYRPFFIAHVHSEQKLQLPIPAVELSVQILISPLCVDTAIPIS